MPAGQGVAAGDADDQAEVGPDEAVLRLGSGGDGLVELGAGLAGLRATRGLPAGLDDAGQLLLLIRREKGHLADLVEVETNGIVHDKRLERANYPSDSAKLQ